MKPLDECPARVHPGRAPLVLPATVVALIVAPAAEAADSLELMPDWIVTGVLLAVFVAIITPLNRLIFRPLLKVMDEREEKIEGARRRAERVQQQAQETLERYESGIRSAHDSATAERRRQIDVARAELGAITRRARQEAEHDLSHAREELGASLESARQSLRASSVELAGLAAERILGRSLS